MGRNGPLEDALEAETEAEDHDPRNGREQVDHLTDGLVGTLGCASVDRSRRFADAGADRRTQQSGEVSQFIPMSNGSC